MRKILKFGMLISMSVWLCACSSDSDGSATAETAAVVATEAEAKIDVDLSKASTIIAYSEIYNMLMSPKENAGKTVKLKGTYYASYSEERAEYNHNVLVLDASACCEVGINFVWDDDEHVYPDEYPEEMSEVVVTGVFEIHERGGYEQGYLAVNKVEF